MSAEWCQHEPPVIINDKRGIPILSAITYAGRAAQDVVGALPPPMGHINAQGDLIVTVKAPAFPWSFFIVTTIGKNGGSPRYHSRVTYGNQDAPLKAGEDYRVVVTLPDAP